MKKITIILLFALLCGCSRRPLSDQECPYSDAESVAIEVSVDWSLTQFDIYGDDFVHRVSFRFFPTDGSAAFDRYIENDVESGTIEIPAGSYSVVVFNESINDIYWVDAISFADVDSFDLFSASIVDQDESLYDFYSPGDQEALSVECLHLASCSLTDFVITDEMCTTPQSLWSDEQLAMIGRLNPIYPQRLTCPTTIEVDIENLSSAYTVHASLTGLAQKVFMASGQTDTLTTTHVGELTQRTWHDESEQLHGVISESRLTFTSPATVSHTLTLGVMLINGSRHSPDDGMIYDVTDQILEAATRYADNDLGASVSLSLPSVSGDVEVNEWGEESTVTIR